MATSTGSRALDFALGIGAYAPQYDLPEEAPQEGGIASALPSRGGLPSKNAEVYAPLIKEAAARHKIPYGLLMGIAQTESSFNPAAVGPKTKYGTPKGMFQMIDSTARRYGVQDQFDPAQEADGAARYLSDLMKRYNGNAKLAAAAYNAGEGNVDKYLSGRAPLPAQTQDYVPKVLGHAAQFGASPLAQAPQSRQPSNPIVPPPEGMQAVWLSNGTQLNAPAGMTLQQVHEKMQKNHPELENVVPTRIMQTGDQTFNVPYNMQDDEAMHHLVNQGLMKDPMEGKGGRGWNNLVSGLERSIGNAALAMGNPEMAQQFYDKAKAGEYQMYESEVEAAKRKGPFQGLKAEVMQNLVYPGMEMLGEFAPAMLPIGGVAGTAAKIAAMVPSSTGSIMQYAKERGVDLTPQEALREGIPLAAVSTVGLPLKGLGLGAGAVEKGLLRRTAEAGATNFAKNVAAMGTMEGLHKEAAGEPVLPQTPEEMARLAESAAWFAGPHALLEGAMPRERPEAPEVAQREPVRTPERVSEVVEPEVDGGPEVAPAVRTELQNIGEMYGRHVMEAEARGEPPMSPEEFMAQYKPEPVVQEEIKDELAPGDIEAAPSSVPVQPSPFVRKAPTLDKLLSAEDLADTEYVDLLNKERSIAAERVARGENPLTETHQRHIESNLHHAESSEALAIKQLAKEKPNMEYAAARWKEAQGLREASADYYRKFTGYEPPETWGKAKQAPWEARDQAVGGQGVEPSRQGVKAPEVSDVKTWQPTEADLAQRQEDLAAARDRIHRGEHPLSEVDQRQYQAFMDAGDKESAYNFYKHKTGATPFVLKPEEISAKAPEVKKALPPEAVETETTKGKPVQEMAPLRERDFTPEEVEQIHAWQDEGISHRDIAKKLKIPYFNYLVKAGKVRAGEGDLGSVIKSGTMKEGEYATHAELEKLPEKDQLSYLQLMGKTKEEMGERLKLSEEEVTNKLQEYGLPDTEAELQRKMSEQRKDYLEAQREERAKYREAGTAPEGVEFENIPHTAESPFKFDVPDKMFAEGESPIVDIDGRKIVKARVNGKSIPFYLSKKGTGGKDAGKWQPFFGVSEKGWFNKGTLEDIKNYYGSDKLREISKHLDEKYGDIRKETHPSVDWSKTAIDSINEGLSPVEHDAQTREGLSAVLSSLESEKEKPKEKLSIDEQEVEQREAEDAAKKDADEERQKREEQEDQEDELDAEEQLKRDELAERKLQKKLQKKRDEEDEDVLRDLPDFDYTEPDRELDYSKGEAAKEAHTPESLAKHLADTYGARKPAVEITTRAQAGVDARTKAFYDAKTKKVHIIADNLGKDTNIHGLLKHEIGVHAQKLGVKDSEFQGILKHMQGMRDKGIQSVREAYSKVPEGTRPERVHEEALGYLVEHHPHLPLVRRFMSWLRRTAHKLTGHAGWLKPEDLSHMAHRVLKKDYGVESRPERRDVQAEKLRSASDDNVRAIRATGITKTEKPLTYRETAEEVAKAAKTSYAKRRGEYIDATDPLTQALQKLDRFDKNLGKLRADLIAAEANQSVGLVAYAIENGIPVINKSGSMMVMPGANLKNAVEFARSKDKNGEELLSWVLRVNIGEHRLEEHAQDIQDLKRIAREILELKGAVKFHDKLGQNKERKLAEKALASKESAYKTIIRERNIDPETLEGREKVVNADMIALRDKLMKDHPWLKEATQEVYDELDGLVNFQLQSGMIDKLTADKWKAAPYVPLYKSLTDLEKDPNFSKLFPRSAEAISQVKQIKGYKHAVNMLENLHKHYYGMMLPAVFNHVRKESISQMLHLDALNRMNESPELSYEKALRKATEAVETKHSGPNTMKVLDNGEEKHYKIQDPDLLQMFAFNRPELSAITRAFSPVTAIQRTAFLKNPAFWGTQLFLDPLYANLTAGAKSLIHPGHALVNLVKIWAGKSEGAKALERHGVDIGYQAYSGKKSLSFERTGEATQFHELFGKRSAFRKAMNMLDRVHNSVDEATRVSVYNAVKKDGKKMGLTGQELEDYAVHRARTYMNFAARGRNQLLNEYRAMTAFTSAAINGADALMKNYKGYGLNEKEGAEVKRIFRNRLMAGVSIGTGLALAQLNASNGKQDGDLFEQLTSIDTGTGIKLPFKWDVGALVMGLPKVFVMTTLLDATNPNSLTANQGVSAAWELIRRNMLPPMHLPDAINPLVEAAFNFSTDEWDAIDNAGAMRYSADARGRSNTFLGEFFGNLLGISGKKADHVGRSYLGKLYDYTNMIADSFTGRMEGMPGADKGLIKVFAGPFYKDEDRVSGADTIYKADDIAGQEVASFNKFKTSNKEKFEEFKNDPKRMAYRRAAPALRNARERLSAYEKQISIVMDSKMPKEAKEARIRQINENKRKAIEQGNATVKRLLGDYAP